MSYVVLARKWRPKFFDEVVGQGHVARTLANAIAQDRVAHAFLFTGARGVGKTSTARILAKALNCEDSDGPTAKPCNECSSCVAITGGQSVDVFEIDGASNRGINEIRELRESVRYAPSRGRFKIYIIDEVHMLTTEAFNALLKTLEEPPPHAKFIFATTEPQKIPVTILSRCQRYDFKRIKQSDIVDHLKMLAAEEGITTEESALQIIARQAAGGMRDALSLLDQVISFAGTDVTETSVNEILGVANRRHLFELSEAVLGHDAGRALEVLDEVNRYGYDLQQFASETLQHFRDLMVVAVVKDPGSVTDLTNTEIGHARQQVEEVDNTLLHRCFGVLSSIVQEMSRSSFPKLVFEMGIIRLAHLEPLHGVDVLVSRLSQLEASMGEDLPSVEYEGVRSGGDQSVRSKVGRENSPVGKPSDLHELGGREDFESKVQPEKLESELPIEGVLVADDVSPSVDSHPVLGDELGLNAPAAAEIEPQSPVLLSPEEPKLEAPGRQPAPAESEPVVGDDLGLLPPADEVVVERPLKLDVPSQPVSEPLRPKAEGPPAEGPAIARLPPDEVLALSPGRRWEVVVEALRAQNIVLAATCEHAYVEVFDAGRVELWFAPKYLALVQDDGRLEEVESVVRALFGDKYTVQVQTRDVDEEGGTMAHARDEELEARRQGLKEELLTNPAVKEAQELFDIDPEKVRVQVQLFDEPQ